MALPTILLREFDQAARISDWVPGKLAAKYEQLESLAHGILSKDTKQWKVHFHLEDGHCEGKALPLLWNNGAYFDSDCLTDNKLHLFAHFERRSNGRPVPYTSPTSTAPPFSRPNTQEPSVATGRLRGASTLDEVGPPLRAFELPVQHSRPKVSRRANVHDLSDSDSDGSGETNFLLSPSDSGRLGDDDDDDAFGGYAQELVHGESQHTLPASATAAQHAIDLEVAMSSNVPKGKYGHKDNWHEIAKEYQQKIAHAKLIKGIYGIPAPAACERCASKGTACRIYDPSLQATQARAGACGECRLRSNTCVMNGSNHHKSGKKRMAPDVVSNEPQAKILRRSTGGDTVRELDHCPVLTCPRRTEPFNNKANLLRHVTAAHPDYDPSRIDLPRHVSVPSRGAASPVTTSATLTRTSRGTGTFVCPVVDCPTPNYTRGDNMRRHIRQKHPESVHAQILEAVLGKTRIELPPPPSSSEFVVDLKEATSLNASQDAFGWRANRSRMSETWRCKIAHAKLIQGKYGVISPDSCANCRKRDTTCMVYHPNLDGAGVFIKACCSQCFERFDQCEIGANLFANILVSTEHASNTQKVHRAESSNGAPTMNEEDNVAHENQEQQLSPSVFTDHGDSFIHCDIPDSRHETDLGEE